MFEYKITFPKCDILVNNEVLQLVTHENLINWTALQKLVKYLFEDYDESILQYTSISYYTKLENGKYVTKPNKHVKRMPHYEVLLRSIVPIKKDYGKLNLQMFQIYTNLYENYQYKFSYCAFISYKQSIEIKKNKQKNYIEFKQKSPLVIQSTLKQIKSTNDSAYNEVLNTPKLKKLKREILNRYENENTTFYYILDEKFKLSLARIIKDVDPEKYGNLKTQELQEIGAKNLILEIDDELEEFMFKYAIDNRLIPVSNEEYLSLLFNTINYQTKECYTYDVYSFSKYASRTIRYWANSRVMYATGTSCIIETDDDELLYKLMLGGAGSLRKYGFGVAYNE